MDLKQRFIFCASAIFALPALSIAQTWDYTAYGARGPVPAVVTLDEKDGNATFRMMGPGLDMCMRVPLKADVTRSSTHIIITPQPHTRGCMELRFQIKLDGTGGFLEIKNGDVWVVDARDRKLTPAK